MRLDRVSILRASPAIALLLIAGLTLYPVPVHSGSGRAQGFWCVACGSFGAVDVLLNVLLFLPFGIALGALGATRRRALLAILATTVAVEILQLIAIAGRTSSIGDILANISGGALGLMLVRVWGQFVDPTPARARTTAFVATVAWMMSRLATAWLLQSSLPAGEWFGQLAPRDVYPATFAGEVNRVSVGGRELTIGRIRDADGLSRSLVTAGVTIHVEARSGPPSDALASIVSVLDREQREMLLLGQEGQDVRIRVRLRAADFRLRVPSLKAPRALAVPNGTLVTLEGEFRRGVLAIRTTNDGESDVASLPLSAGLGWALLLPFDVALTERARWLTSTWTFALLSLCGYWWGIALPVRGRRAGGLIAQFALLVIAGFGIPVVVAASPRGSIDELALAIGGAAVGIFCGARRARLEMHRAALQTH